MGLPRSTYYDAPSRRADDAEIIATMMTICDEFEVYGYRRVGAELRHRDIIVNSKKVRRLMREHDLQPKRRRLRLPGRHPRRLVAPSGGICDQPFDRRTLGDCSAEGCHPSPAASEGLHPPLGSRLAICM